MRSTFGPRPVAGKLRPEDRALSPPGLGVFYNAYPLRRLDGSDACDAENVAFGRCAVADKLQRCRIIFDHKQSQCHIRMPFVQL